METKVCVNFQIFKCTHLDRKIDSVCSLVFLCTIDEKMNIPKRHIPSRFVCPIPPDFASLQKLKQKKGTYKKVSHLNSNEIQNSYLQNSLQIESIGGQHIDDVLDLDDGEFEW